MARELEGKAVGEYVEEQLQSIIGRQAKQAAELMCKADAVAVQDRHENHVVETQSGLASLKAQRELRTQAPSLPLGEHLLLHTFPSVHRCRAGCW